jgi:chorismate-pyruvate lyase
MTVTETIMSSTTHLQVSSPRRCRDGRTTSEFGHRAHRSADLTPLQRFLLATDGTVTPALVAYLGEPVAVRLLRQATVTLTRTDDELEVCAGQPVLERSIVLYGQQTGTIALYADSRIALDRLSTPVRNDLLGGEMPIGLVLRSNRVETFRDWLGEGLRPATPEVAAHIGPRDVCWRTYAIVSGGHPLMVVHEEFPVLPVASVA